MSIGLRLVPVPITPPSIEAKPQRRRGSAPHASRSAGNCPTCAASTGQSLPREVPSGDSAPWMRSNTARASSRRPAAASASISQNVQMTKATEACRSRRSGCSAAASRRMPGPCGSRPWCCPDADLRRQEAQADHLQQRRVQVFAAIVADEAVPASRSTTWAMTSSRIRSAAASEFACARRLRAGRAIRAMRSAAAQHIRLENVCGFHSVRYSQIPASGTPASEMALRASPSINSQRRRRTLRAHPFVQEDRRQRQHHLPVDVVLRMQGRRRCRSAPAARRCSRASSRGSIPPGSAIRPRGTAAPD